MGICPTPWQYHQSGNHVEAGVEREDGDTQTTDESLILAQEGRYHHADSSGTGHVSPIKGTEKAKPRITEAQSRTHQIGTNLKDMMEARHRGGLMEVRGRGKLPTTIPVKVGVRKRVAATAVYSEKAWRSRSVTSACHSVRVLQRLRSRQENPYKAKMR